MRIWHISDTHCFHNHLQIPENIQTVIHSGDCSNSSKTLESTIEVSSFISWYKELQIPYKVFVAGNHDTSIYNKQVLKKDFDESGIIYLQDNGCTIEGYNIYGSPWTPTFMNWSFMRKREKMHEVWSVIPNDTDILITHGAPKGILDLTENKDRSLEQCGDTALKNNIMKRSIKLHCFGHIHNGHGIVNSGVLRHTNHVTVYSNGSCVTDAEFNKGITSHGNIIEL